MNGYKTLPILFVVLLVPLVLAAPVSEFSYSTGDTTTGGNVGGQTYLKNNGASCTVASECAGGYCIHSICRSASTYCGDSFCDSGETSSSCSADCTTTTTTTGGTTGGGTSASTASESKTISSIVSGGSETVTITKATDLKVEKVVITAKAAVSSAQVTVKESSLSSLPSGASSPITGGSGSILKYIEIEKTNIPDASVDKVVIEFRVEKSWVTSNNIALSTIALQRLVGTTWNKLTTTLKEETSTLYKFEAESPGLSFFAITGETKAEVQTACPDAFDCCIGEVNYTDKACDSGYKCTDNKCVAVVESVCPVCPSASDWSACADGKQSRTNYMCSADTGYECSSYTEEQSCPVPEKPSRTIYYVIGFVILLGVAYLAYRRFMR